MDREQFFIETLVKTGVTQGLGDDCVVMDLSRAKTHDFQTRDSKTHDSKTHGADSKNAKFATIKEDAKMLIFGMDSFVENTHFRCDWFSFKELGAKAVAVNVSDIIAKNATPKYALLSVGLPKDLSRKNIAEIALGIAYECQKHGIKIIGGDTIKSELLSFNITMIGVKKNSKIIFRRGIKRGDILCYTSDKKPSLKLGGVLKNLNFCLKFGRAGGVGFGVRVGVKSSGRFRAPVLRNAFLRDASRHINASMDITDGIYQELKRLSALNRVGFAFFGKKLSWDNRPCDSSFGNFACLNDSTKNLSARFVSNFGNLGRLNDSAKNLGGKRPFDSSFGKNLSGSRHLNSSFAGSFRHKHFDIFNSGEEYELLIAINPKKFLALKRLAQKHRILIVPFATATFGRFKIRTKSWH